MSLRGAFSLAPPARAGVFFASKQPPFSQEILLDEICPFYGEGVASTGEHRLATTYTTQDRSTCGREAVKSVLRLFDELVKCGEEGILKDVREAAEGVE